MKEYGYINEGGYLRSMTVEDYAEQYLDSNGQVKTRIVTAQEQIVKLANAGWKPVETIEAERLKADDGYVVRIVPFDAGDCIKFRYEVIPDLQLKRKEIQRLKNELTASDYKVIKCYEASLAGKELPYDIAALHIERQQVRDRINQIEVQISAIK